MARRSLPLSLASAAVAGCTLLSTALPAQAAPPTGPAPAARDQAVPATEAGPWAPTLQTTAGAPTASADRPVLEADTDRFVVGFRPGTSQAEKQAVLAAMHRSTPAQDPKLLKKTADGDDVVATDTKLDPAAQETVRKRISADPRVVDVRPDKIVRNALAAYPSAPSDPYFSSSQWNLRAIDAPAAWQKATGAGVTIGVADTGLTRHPDLDGKTVPGYDFVTGAYDVDGTPGRDADPSDPGVRSSEGNWHGTHVAGIAAASTNNGQGIAGVAPDARISMARVLGLSGDGYVSDFADGITWLSGGHVDGVPDNARPSQVVNFSANWPGSCDASMKSAIDSAASRGVPVVVAAGNSGIDASSTTPSNCLGAVIVGATANNVVTGYSNYGAYVDVVAPGGAVNAGQITSTWNSGGNSPGAASYGPMNGTSMAAPHVAGTIALMKQRNPSLTVERIRSILVSTGTIVGGYRQIDAERAVAAVPAPAAAPVVSGPQLKGAIGAYYRAHGGQSVFGKPTGNETGGLSGGGVYQQFDRGHTIYWSPATGAYPVKWSGAIGALVRAHGWENGFGYPVTPEVETENGLAWQSFRSPATGRTSTIVWTRSTGAASVFEGGGIGRTWTLNGREDGWGVPVSEEASAGGRAHQWFRQGSVLNLAFWTASTGTHVIRETGAIGGAWGRNGREDGWGVPTTDEYRGNDGRIHQRFSNGVEATWTAAEGVRTGRWK